ncbi:MAG TPA: ABC transporter permease [Gemmatimonadales bacterium]|nr:ABC transporter permease [Gemmatimonadales bacterium]
MPLPRNFRFPRRSSADLATEVDDELAFHLEMRIGDLIKSGLDPAEAERRARAEFGDLEGTRAYCLGLARKTERSARVGDLLEELRHDLAQAWRTVRRQPGFTLVAVLTLALAIGANTAIYTVIRSVLLRPLPFGAPDELVLVTETDPTNPSARNPISALNLLDYRARQRLLTGIAGSDSRSVTWRPDRGDPELLDALSVTPNTFALLQASPLLGRAFSEEEDIPGGEPRVILSYGFWQAAFGGSADILGRTITLNDLPYRVLGIMPRGFSVVGDEAMWTPLGFAREMANPAVSRRQHFVRTFARLKPGVTLEAAQADLARISRQLEVEYPDANTGRVATLAPLSTALTRDVGPNLLLLQLASALVLLMACVNLANLTLARGMVRRRELALRAALGAGRNRLVIQLLAESLLLALLGGALGTGLAMLATRTLLALEPAAVPAFFSIHPDRTVLLFALGISLLTGVLFGLVPALEAARPDLRQALQDGGRGSSDGTTSGRMRRSLVVAQVALAVVLLTGAGLLLRSFAELARVPLGFDPDRVMTAEVRVSGERYDPPPMVNGFYDRLLDGIRSSPGVVAVGATMKLPGRGMVSSSLVVEGQPSDPTHLPDVGLILVRGDYFPALRVPLIAGRWFAEEDRLGTPGVVLVNQTAARSFFPDGQAVGRRIRLGPDPNAAWSTVIGVVGDMREKSLEDLPEPVVYSNHVQNTWWRSLTLVVRTKGDPIAVEPAIREALRAADPTLALRNVRSLDAVLGSILAARRLTLALVGGFAGVALLLAAVGLYGVLAFTVTSRRREFGVRLALGADRRSVLLLVLRQGLGWAVLGFLVGLVGAVAGGQVMRGRLYGITPTDGYTYLMVTLGLLSVAVIACLLPAARATRVDPVESLRAE